jgi:hypothetical protein
MADSTFDWVCQELEAATGLDRLAARGTVRLALKTAGLEPAALTPEQAGVVLERVLPAELGARGVADAERLCREILGRLGRLGPQGGTGGTSPEEIFARLGSR